MQVLCGRKCLTHRCGAGHNPGAACTKSEDRERNYFIRLDFMLPAKYEPAVNVKQTGDQV
jgi:hypothetical protein